MKLKKLFKQIKETKTLPYAQNSIKIEISLTPKGKWMKNAIIEHVNIEESRWRNYD